MKKDIIKRLLKLFIGGTIAAFSIASVINSGLGCFALTAANMSLATMTGLSLGTIGMIVDLTMLAIATYKGEGIGVTALVNATYCSYMIDIFHAVLPVHPLMVLGLLIIPLGWGLMGKAGLGDTASNLLMNIFAKETRFNLGIIRAVEECIFMGIGLIAASQYVTWFTIVLSLGLGYLLQYGYKLIKYDPTAIKHQYFIKRH